jgi:hypothetical protein
MHMCRLMSDGLVTNLHGVQHLLNRSCTEGVWYQRLDKLRVALAMCWCLDVLWCLLQPMHTMKYMQAVSIFFHWHDAEHAGCLLPTILSFIPCVHDGLRGPVTGRGVCNSVQFSSITRLKPASMGCALPFSARSMVLGGNWS